MHDLADSCWNPANFDFVGFRPPLANIAFRKAVRRDRGDAGERRFRRSLIRLRIELLGFLSGGGSEQNRSHRVKAGQGRAMESASEEKPPKLEQSEELDVEKWRRRFAEGLGIGIHFLSIEGICLFEAEERAGTGDLPVESSIER